MSLSRVIPGHRRGLLPTYRKPKKAIEAGGKLLNVVTDNVGVRDKLYLVMKSRKELPEWAIMDMSEFITDSPGRSGSGDTASICCGRSGRVGRQGSLIEFSMSQQGMPFDWLSGGEHGPHGKSTQDSSLVSSAREPKSRPAREWKMVQDDKSNLCALC